MAKEDFVAAFQAGWQTLNEAIAGLDEAQAGKVTHQPDHWPTIKDMLGNLAAWEREVLIADEMIKRNEESYLAQLDRAEFDRSQAAHRRSWSLTQITTELDLNYEALLMAWDEYEGEDGPFGPSSWQPDQPNSLWWLVERQDEYRREIARRRGFAVS